MESYQQFLVEFDLRPAYYDDFHCLAGDCHANCCKGWHIPFDRRDYMKLKRQKGSPELNARMEHGLRRLRSDALNEHRYGEFRMNEDGRCPFQSESGLCLLQMEKGAEILPEVCQAFPRVQEPSASGYLERALSPACEAVLALLWDLPEGVDFLSDPLEKPMTGKISSALQGSLVPAFQDIRSQCIDFLQDRRLPLPQRIMLMGLALKNLTDGERDVARWLERAERLSEQAARDGIPLASDNQQALPLYLSNCIRILHKLISAPDDLRNVRGELLNTLDFEVESAGASRGTISIEPYLEARARYEENFRDREYFMENLMVSLFFQMKLPATDTMERLWRSYTAFCNLYGFYRFLAVMSCRKGAAGDRDELFRMIVFGSRGMIHNMQFNESLLDSLYQNDSATLAHMAILLSN